MAKRFLFVAMLFFTMKLVAQTGIGTTSPDPSAKLEVKSDNKGFLPPRVTLTSSTDGTTIPSPATGLLVYNTGNNAGLRAGYYYWNGTDWTVIATPISAQTVDYVSVSRTGSDLTVNSGDVVIFNTKNSGNIPYNTSTGFFTLTAGKTYKLLASVSISNGNTAAKEVNFLWKNADGVDLGARGELLSPSANVTASGSGVAYAVYTPLTNTTVALYVNYSSSNTILWQNYSFASIEQIGSSSIINPWILSGTNTFNTTGNVGIGTNNPTEKLDVTGTLGVSGTATLKDLVKIGTGIGDEGGEINFAVAATNTSLSTRVVQDIWRDRLRFFDGNTKGVYIDLSKAPTGVNGEITYKNSGIVNAGTFVQLDNLKATVSTTDGSRSLSIASVSGSFAAYIVGSYTLFAGGVAGSGTTKTVTTTEALALSWNFIGAGDTAIYTIVDTTNNRGYRVTMMIGPSYNNNFISIERLH